MVCQGFPLAGGDLDGVTDTGIGIDRARSQPHFGEQFADPVVRLEAGDDHRTRMLNLRRGPSQFRARRLKGPAGRILETSSDIPFRTRPVDGDDRVRQRPSHCPADQLPGDASIVCLEGSLEVLGPDQGVSTLQSGFDALPQLAVDSFGYLPCDLGLKCRSHL